MSRSLILKLTLTYSVIILLVLALVGGFLPLILREHFFRLNEKDMVKRATELGDLIEKNDLENTDDLAGKLEVLQSYTGDRIIILYRSGEWFDLTPGSSKGRLRVIKQARAFLTSSEINQLWEGKPLVRRSVKLPNQDSPVQNILSVAVPLHDQEDPGKIIGALFINTPIEGIMEITRSTYRVSLFLLLASGVLAVVACFYLSRTVSRPLRQMNQAALALAQGDYKCRVEVTSDDEVGELSSSFNRLARRLEAAARETAQLEQMRRDFVANVSHELRAPLTLIRGYTEALLDQTPGPDTDPQVFYRIILDESLRMENLISELLDLSKLEAGGSSLSPEEVDLSAVARQIVDRMRPRAKEQGVEMTLEVPKGLPTVLGDGHRLEQLLIIFLDNALKYTRSGGEVSLGLEEAGDMVRVSVKDSGRGIPPEDLPYIWERFYKVDKSRSRDECGTGLGLAIARQLIEMHHGSYAVVSEPGQGSTFSFTLPRFTA